MKVKKGILRRKFMSYPKKTKFTKLLRSYVVKMFDDDIFGLSAEMAFYLLTALFPCIILIFVIATTVSSQMQSLLFSLIRALPREAEEVIMNMLLDFHGGLAIIISCSVLALWCISNVINTLRKAMNRFYGVTETRHFIKTRILGLFFALIIIVLVVLSFALIIFGEGTGHLLKYFLNLFKTADSWDRTRYIIVFPIFLAAVSVIFNALPNKKLHFKSVFGGALLTTVTWAVASWGFSFYVNNFSRYHLIYGSLAGIVILTTWVYMTGFVILMGGELNALRFKTCKARRIRRIRKMRLAEINDKNGDAGH